MGLLRFEIKRFITHPKNRICLVLLSSLLVGLLVINQTIFQKQFLETDLVLARSNVQESAQNVNRLTQATELHPEDAAVQQELIAAVEEHELLSQQLQALEHGDKEQFAVLENQLNRIRLSGIAQEDSVEYQELAARIAYYEAVKKAGGTFGVSVNDSPEAAFIIGRSMMAWLSSTVLFILIIVLVSDGVSHDIENGQIRFYQLLGRRNLKQLLFKLLVPIVVVFATVFLTFVCLYVGLGFVNGFGTWMYPYLLLDGSLIPVWQLALRTLALFMTSLLFLSSLGQLLSLLFKKSLVVIGVISVLVTGFTTLSQEAWFQAIKVYLPFEYLGYGQLANDILLLPNNGFCIGIIYLVVLSSLFVAVSYRLYTKYSYRKVGRV